MAMQPNRGKSSSGSPAAKRLAEEKANRNMGRLDMASRSGFGETSGNWHNKQLGFDFAKFEGNLSGFKKRKQNNQVTSRQTIGSESQQQIPGGIFRRDIPMETAPLIDLGGHGMSPKFKGYQTVSTEYGDTLVPERKRRR